MRVRFAPSPTGALHIGGARAALYNWLDRKSTRLNSSHANISYAVFFFNDPAPTEIYTLSLPDALPISAQQRSVPRTTAFAGPPAGETWAPISTPRLSLASVLHARALRSLADGRPPHRRGADGTVQLARSEEHTSELQSRQYLVCRLFF